MPRPATKRQQPRVRMMAANRQISASLVEAFATFCKDVEKANEVHARGYARAKERLTWLSRRLPASTQHTLSVLATEETGFGGNASEATAAAAALDDIEVRETLETLWALLSEFTAMHREPAEQY